MPMAGSEKSSRKATTSDIQANTGIRSMVIPGARMVKAVAMKLTEEAIEATPSNWSPIDQKSIRTTSVSCCESGA